MRSGEQRTSRAPADGFWMAPEMPGLELQQATYTRWTFPKHSHDVFSLCAYDAGAEALHLQGKKVVASAGSLLTVAPGEMQEGHT